MKNILAINKIIMFSMLLSLTSMLPLKSAHALLTCTAREFYSKTVPIIANDISAGNELPIGTVIYRGTMNEASGPASYIDCKSNISNDTGNFNFNLGIDSAPMPLSSWSGSPFPGVVYQTNIPGIGIAVWYGGNGVTQTKPYALGGTKSLTVLSPSLTASMGIGAIFDISLVKIGPTPPGSYVINSSSFPTVKWYYSPVSNVVGPTTISRLYNFSGSINVTVPTCTTPDVNVQLGKYDINSSFPSSGKATPWVDFSVQLTNCPVFQGYYSNAVTLVSSVGPSIPTATTNKIGMVVTPQTPIVNASAGMFAVTPSAGAAQGVAIQLANVQAGNIKAMVNFATEYKYDMSSSNGSTFTIPMSARYISTSPTVKPGVANGTVTYTINYY